MNEDTRNPETNMDDLSDEQLDEVAGGLQTYPPTYVKPGTDPGGTPFGGLEPWPLPTPEDPPVHGVPHQGPPSTS